MEEKISGVVERITYHNEENGWSVFKVTSFGSNELVTVTVHQAEVYPGATIEFVGNWTTHPRFGRQFKATQALEKKPASVNALEKYIGSGLIHGVGPAIAKRIVKYFGKETLEVFESEIERLQEVKGISAGKLEKIKETWEEHRAIRDVMIFLQSHDISTLYAVKIFKTYGNDAIPVVQHNPYRLAKDIYGIGFLSADRIALSIGIEKDSSERIGAAVLHVLAAARDNGHCYLTSEQVCQECKILLRSDYTEIVLEEVNNLADSRELCTRVYYDEDRKPVICYYNKTLFYDEKSVAETSIAIAAINRRYTGIDLNKEVKKLEEKEPFPLSDEQRESVLGMVTKGFSILTGGPGCGKTTTLRLLVLLLQKLKKEILLAAPTGRAAQRMSEVIGIESKTIHRLLKFNPQSGMFQHSEEDQLETDVVVVDECSMLDVSLSASLLKAIKPGTQVIFIGDVDQLPSVGAGNVLSDLINSTEIPVFHLNTVFRQAKESLIISYAHKINKGEFPLIETPFKDPALWKSGTDCMFIDAEEATNDQMRFIKRSKAILKYAIDNHKKTLVIEHNKKGDEVYKQIETDQNDLKKKAVAEEQVEYYRQSEEATYLSIPEKFRHVDPQRLMQSPTEIQELSAVLKRVHKYSSLHYGHTASQMILKLYKEIIPKYLGADAEIQVLSPMTRGSLGTQVLNVTLQEYLNPAGPNKPELKIGDRIYRKGDRVIQKRNNYDLEVYNGDIGSIFHVNLLNQSLQVKFGKGKNQRLVQYELAVVSELDLAYTITIHKSQGSEFDAVIIPIAPQHYNMLYRNLIYTGLTRGKKMMLFVGSRFALEKAVMNEDNRLRQTLLKELLTNEI